MPFILKGASAMSERIRSLSARFPDDVAKALYQEAQIEMTESKRRVPVQFGVLRASGHVQDPIHNGKNISVTLAYGGAAADYAVVVHEDLNAFHPHGQAKYLESVLKESAPHMASRLAKRLDFNKMMRNK